MTRAYASFTGRMRPCPTRRSSFDTCLFPCVNALGFVFSLGSGLLTPKLEHPMRPSIGPFKVTSPGRHWRTGLADSSTLDGGQGGRKGSKSDSQDRHAPILRLANTSKIYKVYDSRH